LQKNNAKRNRFAIIINIIIAPAESLFSIKLNSIYINFISMLMMKTFWAIKRNFMHQFNIILFLNKASERGSDGEEARRLN
jgi:hypothetical protein